MNLIQFNEKLESLYPLIEEGIGKIEEVNKEISSLRKNLKRIDPQLIHKTRFYSDDWLIVQLVKTIYYLVQGCFYPKTIAKYKLELECHNKQLPLIKKQLKSKIDSFFDQTFHYQDPYLGKKIIDSLDQTKIEKPPLIELIKLIFKFTQSADIFNPAKNPNSEGNEEEDSDKPFTSSQEKLLTNIFSTYNLFRNLDKNRNSEENEILLSEEESEKVSEGNEELPSSTSSDEEEDSDESLSSTQKNSLDELSKIVVPQPPALSQVSQETLSIDTIFQDQKLLTLASCFLPLSRVKSVEKTNTGDYCLVPYVLNNDS